jgi:antitoxin component of MazEF toxin-antitoxin module
MTEEENPMNYWSSTGEPMTTEELLKDLDNPNTFILRRTPAQRLELAKILKQIMLQNRQEEVNFGAPVGKELF